MYLIICHNTTADSLTPLICILMIFAVMSTIPYYQGYVSGKKKRVTRKECESVLRNGILMFGRYSSLSHLVKMVLWFCHFLSGIRSEVRRCQYEFFIVSLLSFFPCSKESLQTDIGLNCFPALSIFWTCSSTSLGLTLFNC